MTDWQERLMAEHSELRERMRKLWIFVGKQEYTMLPDDERGRLRIQLSIMEAYACVLEERIRQFRPEFRSAR